MRVLSQLVSYIFHPLLLPTYAFLYIMYINPYIIGGWQSPRMYLALAQVFINSFFFPAIIILLLKQLGFIDSFQLKTREERIIPFIATLIIYIWTYAVFLRSDMPGIFSNILLGALLAMILAFMLTILSNKISLHTLGAGLFFALVLKTIHLAQVNIVPFIFAVTAIAGIIATARLYLKAHIPREIYFGFVIGMLCLNLGFLF